MLVTDIVSHSINRNTYIYINKQAFICLMRMIMYNWLRVRLWHNIEKLLNIRLAKNMRINSDINNQIKA